MSKHSLLPHHAVQTEKVLPSLPPSHLAGGEGEEKRAVKHGGEEESWGRGALLIMCGYYAVGNGEKREEY